MAMTTAHLAAFSGYCRRCGLRYPPRTPIVMSADGLGWVHAACPGGPVMRPAQPGEVVCPDCFLIHPKGACDR